MNLENDAPVNVGQLKHVAAMARLHLQASLAPAGSSGEGPAIAALVAAFTTGDPENAAPINIGQLKNTASVFYDRLAAAGWDWQTGSFGTATTPYPWTGTVHPENGAAANIGQLKNLFSFELTSAFLAEDNDSDGMPSWWELSYGFDPASDADGGQDADGDGLTNSEEYVAGASPHAVDTDNDWANDLEERNASTDPNSPYSAPLVLCYLEDIVSWHGSMPPVYGDPIQPTVWHESFDRWDSRGDRNRPFILPQPRPGPIYDPVPPFSEQAPLVVYPEITAWSTPAAASFSLFSLAYFNTQDTQGEISTKAIRFWLRGPKQPFPVTRLLKITEWTDRPPVPPLTGGYTSADTYVPLTLLADHNLSGHHSVTPTLSPAGVHYPGYVERAGVDVSLMPVEFKKLWETKNKANQIVVKARRDDPKDDKQTADADGNLYGTPRYLLYVTADPSDSKYHVSLDCDLGEHRDQFVCAAYNGGTKISGSDKAFPAASDQPADMLIPATGPDQSGQAFAIKIAFDANKNGLIDTSEPLIDLIAAKSETGSPAPPMIRGFSMAAVDAAKSTILGQANGSGFTGWKPNFLGAWFVPNAQSLEKLFYDGAIGGMVQDYQPTTTLDPAILDAFGPPGDFNEWLTHHAGSNFNADGVTTVQHYYWNPSKRISNLIANSSPLSLLKSNGTITSQVTSVTDATVENFKQPSVPVGQTQTFPSGAAGYELQPVLAGLGAPHSSPAWVPKQTLLVGDQDGYGGAIPDDAFGTVGRSRFINGEYRFIVKKEAREESIMVGMGDFVFIPYTAVVVYLRVSGSSQDLYDFNHNGGGLSIPAAITQLSYGNGGYGRTNGVIFRATVDILKDYEVKEIRLP